MRPDMLRKLVALGIVLTPMAALLPACEEKTPQEKAADRIEDRTDQAADAIEDRGDQIKEKTDEAY